MSNNPSWLQLPAVVSLLVILAAFAVNRYLIKRLDAGDRTVFLFGSTAFAYLLFMVLAFWLAKIPEDGALSFFGLVYGVPVVGVMVCLPGFVVGVLLTAISRIKFRQIGRRSEIESESDSVEPTGASDNPYSSPRKIG